MTIAYESDRCVLHHGDALVVLRELPNESVGLVVTDPPYGREWISNVRADGFGPMAGDARNADSRSAIRSVLAECVRITEQNRHLYVFGPSDILSGLKVTEPVELVWDKGVIGSGDLTGSWGPQHEPISFVVSKWRHAGQAGNDSVAARLRKGSVLRVGRRTGRTVRHPSEKPIPLLSELIESSSRVGETVLDPFAGIGSTAVAAILLGRKAIAVEIDERWIPPAIERIRHAERLRAEMEQA